MSETLRRIFTAAPVFEREVPFSFSTPTQDLETISVSPIVPAELGGGGGGTFGSPLPPQTPIPPVTGTRTLTARGAPYALSAISDFLVGLGAGVPAAQQQQAARQENVRSLLGEEARRAALSVAQQQQRFENQLSLRQEQRTSEKAAVDLQRAKAALDIFSSPNKFDSFLSQAVSSIGPLSPEEQAVMDSVALEAQQSLDVTPVSRGLQHIHTQRSITGRTRSGVFQPDESSPTGWVRVQLDAKGQEVSRIPSVPPTSFLPRVTTSEFVVVDDRGNISVVPKVSVTQPTIPGQKQITPPTPAQREGRLIEGVRGRVSEGEIRAQVAFAEIRRVANEMEKNVEQYRTAKEVGKKLEALGKINTQMSSLAQIVRQRGEVGTLNEGDINRARNAIVTARSLVFEDLPFGLGAIQKAVNDDRLRQLEDAITTAQAARDRALGPRGTAPTSEPTRKTQRRVIDLTK